MTTLSTINRFLRDSASYLGVAVSRTRWFAIFLPLRRMLAQRGLAGGKAGGRPGLALPPGAGGGR